MGAYHVDVQIKPAFRGQIDADEIARVARCVLDREGQPGDVGISLVITDDEQIRGLNRTYRRVDRATDVLAFPSAGGAEFVIPDEAGLYLGDVIISYPMAMAQAAERSHPVEAELAILVVHGCLHLLGYDDTGEEGRGRMWARQEEILSDLGWEGVSL